MKKNKISNQTLMIETLKGFERGIESGTLIKLLQNETLKKLVLKDLKTLIKEIE